MKGLNESRKCKKIPMLCDNKSAIVAINQTFCYAQNTKVAHYNPDFRSPFSEAFSARQSLRQNTGQRHTILLLTAYSYSIIKFSSQSDKLAKMLTD